MRIGTDVSLKTCLEEGYTVMDFRVRDLYPRGRKDGIDKNHCCRFSASVPAYLVSDNPFAGRLWESSHSWNSLLELYLKYKTSIDDCSGFEHWDPKWEQEPTEYDMLNLADAVQAYCGLD